MVALFFLGLDVAEGRPLWTPHALGSVLFLGSVPAHGAPVSLALIGAYTFVHGYVFVSVGLIAAFFLDWRGLPEMQRALFARLLLQDADIILLDEPFTAIDARTTADLLALVQR